MWCFAATLVVEVPINGVSVLLIGRSEVLGIRSTIRGWERALTEWQCGTKIMSKDWALVDWGGSCSANYTSSWATETHCFRSRK